MNVATSGDRSPDTVKKIMAGTRMVTPRKPLTVSYGGRRETLTPGRSRLAADHALVRSNPSAFRACDPDDSATRARLRSMGGRTTTRTTTRPRVDTGELNLPGTTFRLPRSGTSGPVLPLRLP